MTPEQIVMLNDRYGVEKFESMFDLCEVAQEEYQREAALLEGWPRGDVHTVFIRKRCPSGDYRVVNKIIEL